MIHGKFDLSNYVYFFAGSRKSATLNPLINAMHDLQDRMKAESIVNNSLDLFNQSCGGFTVEEGMAIDDFFLANASFTLPRLHEMMVVSGIVPLIFSPLYFI